MDTPASQEQSSQCDSEFGAGLGTRLFLILASHPTRPARQVLPSPWVGRSRSCWSCPSPAGWSPHYPISAPLWDLKAPQSKSLYSPAQSRNFNSSKVEDSPRVQPCPAAGRWALAIFCLAGSARERGKGTGVPGGGGAPGTAGGLGSPEGPGLGLFHWVTPEFLQGLLHMSVGTGGGGFLAPKSHKQGDLTSRVPQGFCSQTRFPSEPVLGVLGTPTSLTGSSDQRFGVLPLHPPQQHPPNPLPRQRHPFFHSCQTGPTQSTAQP